MLSLRTHHDRRSGAFTLIELIVCIAIIAALVGLVVPGLSRAKRAGARVACAAQLRSIAIATASEAMAMDSMPVYRENERVDSIGVDSKAWICPDDRGSLLAATDTSYAYFGIVGPFSRADFSEPKSIRGDIALRHFEASPSSPLYKEASRTQRHAHIARFDGCVWGINN